MTREEFLKKDHEMYSIYTQLCNQFNNVILETQKKLLQSMKTDDELNQFALDCKKYIQNYGTDCIKDKARADLIKQAYISYLANVKKMEFLIYLIDNNMNYESSDNTHKKSAELHKELLRKVIELTSFYGQLFF